MTKFKNTTDDITLRGVDFPKGKAVEVTDASLIKKLMSLPQFEEVKAAPKKAKSRAKKSD